MVFIGSMVFFVFKKCMKEKQLDVRTTQIRGRLHKVARMYNIRHNILEAAYSRIDGFHFVPFSFFVQRKLKKKGLHQTF